MIYDKSQYYIDFSDHTNLSNEEKVNLEKIQELYRPIERVDYLLEYKIQNKITSSSLIPE